MKAVFPNAKIDLVPNIIVPANMLMLASALKSPVFFVVALGLTALLNGMKSYFADPFWKSGPRIWIASLAVPVCIYLLFLDSTKNIVAVLSLVLGYNLLAVIVEIMVRQSFDKKLGSD